MATLIEIARLLNERNTLWNKFRGGVIKTAASVYAEDVGTANHANRLLWAQDVLLTGNVDSRALEMYRMAMTNTDIVTNGDDSPDTDVEWVIAYFLNDIANGVA